MVSRGQRDDQSCGDEPDDGGGHRRQEPPGDGAGEDAERQREHRVAEHHDAVAVEEDVVEPLPRRLHHG